MKEMILTHANKKEFLELLEIIGRNDSKLTLLSIDTDANVRAGFSDKDTKAIAEALQKNNRLTAMKLGKLTSHEGVRIIFQAIEKNTTLTSIYLKGRDAVNDLCVQAIAKLLEKNKTLTSISLKNTRTFYIEGVPLLTAQGLNQICSALKKNTTLTSFELWLWDSSGYQLVTMTHPVIENTLNRNQKIIEKTKLALNLAQIILDIKEQHDTQEEYNKIVSLYANITALCNEIQHLHPAASQLAQFREAYAAIAAKCPWLVEPSVALEFFNELNEDQKTSDKNQMSFEIIVLNYYAKISKETGYSYSKLLGFMLQNWNNSHKEQQMKHLLHQCLYGCIHGKGMQAASLAIEPLLTLETLATNNNKIPSLLQEIPGVYKIIAAIIHEAKTQDSVRSEAPAALVRKKIDDFGQKLPQFFELISKIKRYSDILDKKSSKMAKNKAHALMRIVSACPDPHQTPNLNTTLDLIHQNKETIRQHRHWSIFNCFFSLFNSKLEHRVTSYKLVTNLEKYIEEIQSNFIVQAEVKSTVCP